MVFIIFITICIFILDVFALTNPNYSFLSQKIIKRNPLRVF